MLSLVLVATAVVVGIGYVTYGRLLERLLRLDPTVRTPAYEFRDDIDYDPQDSGPLLSQHFSAIAAAGPIIGPILAGAMFGWVPAFLWILVGCLFVGGVHDLTALTASIRHKARSIAEVVREHMSRRAFVLFLMFVWLALVYIIVAFTDITARSFVGKQNLAQGEAVTATDGEAEKPLEIKGAAIAASSLVYLVLPILMGLWQKYGKLSTNAATLIFLPLVGASIYVGSYIPFDVEAIVRSLRPGLSDTDVEQTAVMAWDVALLIYCCIASVIPMWLLLQPRGHLGGYFLYVALLGGVVGLLFSSDKIQYPAVIWKADMVPMLFITIACGACSGFHAMIASGTTSKQLKLETDARPIAYGAMLLEGLVAVLSLCCVMRLSATDPLIVGKLSPQRIYGQGIGAFLSNLGIPPHYASSFALMALTTFVYDTLDVCTRLGRYILQELTGWYGTAGRWFGTIVTAGVPVYFVLLPPQPNAKGDIEPLYKLFWALFGASNQLLAALSLLGVTVWLWRTRRAWWVWLVTGVPTLLMYVMSSWALVRMVLAQLQSVQKAPTAMNYTLLSITSLLILLAAAMLVEAVRALVDRRPEPPAVELAPVPA